MRSGSRTDPSWATAHRSSDRRFRRAPRGVHRGDAPDMSIAPVTSALPEHGPTRARGDALGAGPHGAARRAGRNRSAEGDTPFVHGMSTSVQKWWIPERVGGRDWWTTALTAPSGQSYRRSCPKGPSGTGDTEITSRTSDPRRSLRALRCPDPTASAAPARVTTARRTVTGIPVSVRPSGPRPSGPRSSSPRTHFRRLARP